MSEEFRFWLYLGFFLYMLYCLFTTDDDTDNGSVGYDPIEDAKEWSSGYKASTKSVKQHIKLNDQCQKMLRKR